MHHIMTYTDGPHVIEITPLPGLGQDDDLEERLHQFITTNWPSLGAAAYEGFRRFGIGAVVVRQRQPQAEISHAFAARHVSYAAGFGAWIRSTLTDKTTRILEEAFETYDPREGGVFIFLQGPVLRAYRVESTLRPPEALERARVLLN